MVCVQKSLLAFAKDSAKKSFQKLRKEEQFYCTSLREKIHITKKFFNHVVFKDSTTRTPEEIMERILIMPFVSHIIEKGEYISKRDEYGKTFIRISYVFWTAVKLSIILEKTQKHCIVLSCFRNTKKDLSLPAVLPHHR